MEDLKEQPLLQMNLDYDGGHILHETVRWSRFLSIVGIVAVLLMILVFALAGSTLIAAWTTLMPGIAGLAGLGTAILVFAIILVLAAFGFMVFMLLRFSVLIRRGIDRQDQAAFTEGIRCLRIYFILSGAFAVLSLLANIVSLINRINP